MKYKLLSSCKNVEGRPNLYQPMLIAGRGTVKFGKNVQIGVVSSRGFYSGYCYLEARNQNSFIRLGNNISISNGFSATALSNITLEDNVIVGDNCLLEDSDGHILDANKRNDEPASYPIHISKNVFIGSNVVVLKGVTIGENSVIGNGSIVTKNIPANVIAAGNPAKVIREL